MLIEIDNDTLNTAAKFAAAGLLWLLKILLHQVKLLFKKVDRIRYYLLRNDPDLKYTEDDDE